MSDKIERPASVMSLADYRVSQGTPAAKSGFEIKALDDEDAEVWLYGEVGWEITAPRVIAELERLDGEGKTITFRINSPGGDVFEGYALGNYISGMQAETVAQVDALAASMASFLAVSCDRCVMHENSFLMIHEPWTITLGDRAEHEAAATLLGKISAQMVAAYEKKRGEVEEGAEDLAVLVAAETWLTAQDAQALGLADEVLDAVELAACVRADAYAGFKNAPEAVSELVLADETPVEELFDDIEIEDAPEVEEDPVVVSLKSAADEVPVSTAPEASKPSAVVSPAASMRARQIALYHTSSK